MSKKILANMEPNMKHLSRKDNELKGAQLFQTIARSWTSYCGQDPSTSDIAERT